MKNGNTLDKQTLLNGLILFLMIITITAVSVFTN
jgi:hypothetical protein